MALVAVFVVGGITVNNYLGVARVYENNSNIPYNVNHRISNIDNGVVIEVTSSDSKTAAFIQEHITERNNEGSRYWGGRLDVKRNVENCRC